MEQPASEVVEVATTSTMRSEARVRTQERTEESAEAEADDDREEGRKAASVRCCCCSGGSTTGMGRRLGCCKRAYGERRRVSSHTRALKQSLLACSTSSSSTCFPGISTLCSHFSSNPLRMFAANRREANDDGQAFSPPPAPGVRRGVGAGATENISRYVVCAAVHYFCYFLHEPVALLDVRPWLPE